MFLGGIWLALCVLVLVMTISCFFVGWCVRLTSPLQYYVGGAMIADNMNDINSQSSLFCHLVGKKSVVLSSFVDMAPEQQL